MAAPRQPSPVLPQAACQGAGQALVRSGNRREGRGSLGVDGMSTTICHILKGWMGSCHSSGPTPIQIQSLSITDKIIWML